MDFQDLSAEHIINTDAVGATRVTEHRIATKHAVTASKTDLLCHIFLLTTFEEKE